MTDELEHQLAALRDAFDESFARAHDVEQQGALRVLLVRAGEQPCALALDDVALLARCPPLTPVPTTAPALAGLTSVRGSIVAVYDLAALLGQASGQPAWIVSLRRDPSVAIAFDALEGQHRAHAEAVVAPAPDAPACVAGHLAAGDTSRTLISAGELLASLTAGAAAGDGGASAAGNEEEPG